MESELPDGFKKGDRVMALPDREFGKVLYAGFWSPHMLWVRFDTGYSQPFHVNRLVKTTSQEIADAFKGNGA
jgi:hypothetical protein